MPNVIARIAFTTMIFGASSTIALAQQSPLARRPPPEVGVGLTRFVPIFGDFVTEDLSEPGAELRVTVPFSKRFAVEGIGTIGRRGHQYSDRTEGLFLIQIRQRLRHSEASRFQPFITYGVAGYWSHFEQHEVSMQQPGGGTTTFPSFSYNEIEEPAATTVGGGFQYRLGRHAAIRAESQLVTFLYLPLGYRFATTLSVPLGRYSMN